MFYGKEGQSETGIFRMIVVLWFRVCCKIKTPDI